MPTAAGITTNVAVQRHPSVVSHRVQGDVVLVHLDTNRIFRLNATAGRVWDLLDRPRGIEEVVTVILEEYRVGRERLDLDVRRTLETLARHGLVRMDDGE